MEEKTITLLLTMATGARKRVKLTITPKTTIRVLRRRVWEITQTEHIPDLEVSTVEGGTPLPQGQDVFPLIEDGGRLFVVQLREPDWSQFNETADLSFIGSIKDPITDLAENHDLYLAGMLPWPRDR